MMMNVRKSVVIAVTCLALLTAGLSTAATTATACTDSVSGTISTQSELSLEGLYTLPAKTPTKLVVFAHGYHNRSTSWEPHLLTAAEHGVVAVAMDYRGTGVPTTDPLTTNAGMPLKAGAEDTIAAAEHFSKRCGIDEVYLMGVSMGGAVSGLALAGRSDLFDVWIDVEGMTNLAETYVEASAVAISGHPYAVGAVQDIKAETGGDPIEIQRRTVVSRIADIKASGIRGAIVVHAVSDGLVPYNQGVEMASALAAAGIPTEFYTVARRSGQESPDDRNDTTITSYIPNSRGYFNELDGHAWEGSTTHQIMVTSLNRLWELVDKGREVQLGYRPFLVDSGKITPGI